MPPKVRKLPSGKFQVSTPEGVTAKGTTQEKAEAQTRLLHGVEYGWKPTGKLAKRKTGRHGDIDHIMSDSGIGKSKIATIHKGEGCVHEGVGEPKVSCPA